MNFAAALPKTNRSFISLCHLFFIAESVEGNRKGLWSRSRSYTIAWCRCGRGRRRWGGLTGGKERALHRRGDLLTTLHSVGSGFKSQEKNT